MAQILFGQQDTIINIPSEDKIENSLFDGPGVSIFYTETPEELRSKYWKNDEKYANMILEMEKINPGTVSLLLHACASNSKLKGTKLLKEIFAFKGWTKDMIGFGMYYMI